MKVDKRKLTVPLSRGVPQGNVVDPPLFAVIASKDDTHKRSTASLSGTK